VLAFNLWYANTDPGATCLSRAQRCRCDRLVEATPQLKNALAPLKVLYPYGVDCIGKILLRDHAPVQASAAECHCRQDRRGLSLYRRGRDLLGRASRHHRDDASLLAVVAAGAPALDATAFEPPPPELPDVPRLVQSLQAANLAAM